MTYLPTALQVNLMKHARNHYFDSYPSETRPGIILKIEQVDCTTGQWSIIEEYAETVAALFIHMGY